MENKNSTIITIEPILMLLGFKHISGELSNDGLLGNCTYEKKHNDITEVISFDFQTTKEIEHE